MQLARAALDEGVAVLRSLGIHDTVLVQSDGGSDFTGEVFQNACLRYGVWVRCKVSQKGGMADRPGGGASRTCRFVQDAAALGAELRHPLGYTDHSSKPSHRRLK